MAENEDRCWPGYEPTPGKRPHSQGSCRPKAESKTTPAEKKFRAKRRKQLDEWEEEHPQTRPQAAQHLAAPGTRKKTAAKKKATKKKATKKAAGKKKNTAGKRAASKAMASRKNGAKSSRSTERSAPAKGRKTTRQAGTAKTRASR